jgi:hypothetical protein
VFDNKKVIPKKMENVDLVGELVLKIMAIFGI